MKRMKRLFVLILFTAGGALLAHGAAQGTAHGAELPLDQATLEQFTLVRQALMPFESIDAAIEAGYTQLTDCMSDPGGAQGIHYANAELIADPALDPLRPEILMYEPTAAGGLRLVGAEYLIFESLWQESGGASKPTLFGQEFHLAAGDDPFYALHLWVWQANPRGFFADWNPLVSC